ncbi:MAG: D-alanyl-D-alanine carboxypeptidase/D-alanyl-D-alanine-endopeptidase, partial [Planctomycetota bacterium]
DVWIVGGGDPNISGRFYLAPETLLLSWAKRLKTMGIHEIRGNLVMDDRLFDREWLHPDWDPRDRIYWYSAEVSALSLNDNCIDLDILGSRRGVQVNLSPQTNYITLVNRLSLGRHSLYRSRKKNQIFLTGSFPRRGRRQISVTIHNPPLYFGTVFSECLKKADIQWKGKIRLAQKDEKRPPSILVVDHTDSLRTVLSVINKRSQNLHAEMVFKLLGKKLGGEGSFEGGRKAVQFFLKKAKISLPHVIRDGSGLSRKNRLSPKLLIALLRWMAQTPQGAPFRHTLAISGRDGTLRKRLNKPHTFGRIFAKTGTLKRVSALSGYAYHGKEKKWYVFSILSNGIPSSQAKRLEDQILDIWLGERQ